jgi:hypothetical protein
MYIYKHVESLNQTPEVDRHTRVQSASLPFLAYEAPPRSESHAPSDLLTSEVFKSCVYWFPVVRRERTSYSTAIDERLALNGHRRGALKQPGRCASQRPDMRHGASRGLHCTRLMAIAEYLSETWNGRHLESVRNQTRGENT